MTRSLHSTRPPDFASWGGTPMIRYYVPYDPFAPLIGKGDTSRCHPSHTTGHTGHVPGGSTRLSLVRNMKSRETERVEVVVAQGLLDRRVAGHAPETGRRTGGDRCMELRYAAMAQFFEAVVPVLPLPPKIRA